MLLTADTPLLSDAPRATPDQCVRALLARPHGCYNDHDIADVIVPTYFAVCASVAIDPLIAIAQMIHETGNLTSFWSQRGEPGENQQRNPAGIGVDGTWAETPPPDRAGWAFNTQRGRWEKGLGFRSWRDDSVPAHIGRLLCYTLPVGAGTDAQQTLIQRAVGYRPFNVRFRGTALVLRQLGKIHNPLGHAGAGWASPGDRYGDMIAKNATLISSS